jgi:signal transduction histidine kinase
MFRSFAIGTISTLALTLAATTFAHSADFGSAGEAKAMLEKAATALKADTTKALVTFNNGGDGFKDRDLYPFCWDAKTGVFNAHVTKTLLGTDIRALKEKDGSPLGQKIFDGVQEGKITTISYNFPKPGGTEPVSKESYITAVGNEACGVGYYK